MNTKRTRRKFTDQQKRDIIDQADHNKAGGGDYKEVLSANGLSSSTLSKWRKELSQKSKKSAEAARMPQNDHRKAAGRPKRKIASKLTLNDVLKTLRDIEKELSKLSKTQRQLESEKEQLLSMTVSDLL